MLIAEYDVSHLDFLFLFCWAALSPIVYECCACACLDLFRRFISLVNQKMRECLCLTDLLWNEFRSCVVSLSRGCVLVWYTED